MCAPAGLVPVALFVLLSAAARTRTISADFVGMGRNGILALLHFGHKVNFLARWTAERECRIAVVVGHGEITQTQNINADESVDATMKDHFRNRKHRKHGTIGKE